MEYNNIQDDYYWGKYRHILSFNEIGIQNVESFGHYYEATALEPLAGHIHKDAIEITYVVSGSQAFEVGGIAYDAFGGDTYITYPNEPHSTGARPQSLCETYWMHIGMGTSEHFLGLASPWDKMLHDRLLNTHSRIHRSGDKLKPILQNAFDSIASGDPALKLSGQSLLLYFLNLFIAEDNALNPGPSADISRAVQYINAHITENITLEELAQQSGLSESRFKTKFKQQVGFTPREYINNQKIKEAQRLLQNGMSVTETAFTLGFSTSNYFASVFKQFTWQKPSEYRKKYRGE